MDRAKSKESVTALLSPDLITLLSNLVVQVRLQYIPAISLKQGSQFLLHDRVCATYVETARKSNSAKLFICEAVEIPTTRLCGETLRALYQFGRRGQRVCPAISSRDGPLPWLIVVIARLRWLAVRGWMGFLARRMCTHCVTALVCSIVWLH